MNLSSSEILQHFCDTPFPQKVSQSPVLVTRVKKCLEGHCFPSITGGIQLWGCRGCYWKDSPSAGTAVERMGFYVKPLSPKECGPPARGGEQGHDPSGGILGLLSPILPSDCSVTKLASSQLPWSPSLPSEVGDVVDGTLMTPLPCSLELRERLGLENSCMGSGLW